MNRFHGMRAGSRRQALEHGGKRMMTASVMPSDGCWAALDVERKRLNCSACCNGETTHIRRLGQSALNWRLAGMKFAKLPTVPRHLLAAYTTVSRVLLNLDETITKE